MTAHAKVTTIAHSASGMGQVWYRVTGTTGVANRQVAYRVGNGDVDARRVRFVGAGATARLTGFWPGDLVGGDADLVLIERAFSGAYLTHGVKTRRSKFARVPAAPVHAAITDALEAAGLDAESVFASRDAAAWWRALTRAAAGDRSVSFLTAAGALRVAARAGAEIDTERMLEMLGAVVRERLTGPVPVGRTKVDAATQLDLRDLELELLTDLKLGGRIWQAAATAAGRHELAGNAGYELTLTLPKSFSLYAITGDPADQELWMDALEAAATRALERLMGEAGFCSTGHRGDGENVTILEADGWAGFIATEISSRAGDPHLHVHCTLPNVLVGQDGVVRTMADGGRELIINAPRFAAWGQEYVIEEAQARGLLGEVWFSPETGEWQVGAFTADHLAAFSRGRIAMNAERDAAADDVPRTAKARARRDRAAKTRVTAAKSDVQPTWAQLRADVLARAEAEGWDLAALRTGTVQGESYGYRPPMQWTDEQWVDWVEGVACRHESTASLARIRSVVDLATAGMPDAERERIIRVVVEQGFERADTSRDLGMKTGGQQWISRAALDHEARLLMRTQASVDLAASRDIVLGHRRAPHGVARFETQRGWSLNDEQQRAVSAIVDGAAPITLISGVGGSGKTSVLAAAHLALGERELLVTSTATRAASKAGHESGAPWMNLTALCARITKGEPIGARIIVVDEASMADVRTLATVSDWCQANHRRLVLQGDTAQLRAVGAGDAFHVLCAVHPDAVVRLETNQRQLTDDGRALAAALHARDLDDAWEILRRTGTTVVARNHDEKLAITAAAVAHYALEHGAENVTCDAVTNAEADELNERIHQLLFDRGTLDPDEAITYRTPTADRVLAPGTVLRVVTPTTGRDEARRLVRDQRATVLTVAPDRVCIRLDDGHERTMSPRILLRHLDYGYAATTHKAQGQTSTAHIATVQPGKDAASMYVSASRARQVTFFVLDARDYLTDHELAQAAEWTPQDLTDEVLDRAKTAMTKRSDVIDSPSQARHPAPGSNPPQSLGYAPMPTPGGMGLGLA
ncbi:MAG: AAA family ATPase [Actinomycetales bacterium]|nr:AAA family ATPase [Actinomycetales bacterium]